MEPGRGEGGGIDSIFAAPGIAQTGDDSGIPIFTGEFWTARQRQAHSLHEISYRACFKPQLPAYFIERLTRPGDAVYDPFSGRGTTALQAALMRRRPVAGDVNPLSAMLVRPRLRPPTIDQVARRLADREGAVPRPALALWDAAGIASGPGDGQTAPLDDDLLAFYHPDTLRCLTGLRAYLLAREARGALDPVDDWIRMVALNRLTGHSPGFFSVYTMPPNQAVSADSQRKINAARGQTPPPRDIGRLILRKSRGLLADDPPPAHPPELLRTGPADASPELSAGAVDLIVTSPPFLDVVDYAGDNWLRGWFAGIDPAGVAIDRHRDIVAWERFVRRCFSEFARIVRPGGHVAFEVGEVRGGKIQLERNVIAAIHGLPFAVEGVLVNQQDFTKTANCWGVDNNARGTNTNRIVLARRAAP